MSKMKLISMTDFVLEQVRKMEDKETAYLKIFNYANFLKQPLTLGMFMPCDESGGVLEEPENYDLTVDIHNQGCHITEEHDIYCEAKERVLFEGLDIDAVKHHISQNRNIEYLSNFGTLTLTPYALKQIGL